MKTYNVIKVTNGYQVVWSHCFEFIKTGFTAYQNYVDNGFFKKKQDAENYANELSHFGEN
mgnify:CR=1|tara:strand:- start:750 stop:929 length:180 start_codon:yes stop_codon:yes gene_type:complete